MGNDKAGRLVLAPNYSYRKRPNGTEVVTERENPIWIDINRITEIESTVNDPKSDWWRVTLGDTRLYLDLASVSKLIESSVGLAQIKLYEYGGLRVRAIGATFLINATYVLSVEQADETYFKVIMLGGARYYTDIDGAIALGIDIKPA